MDVCLTILTALRISLQFRIDVKYNLEEYKGYYFFLISREEIADDSQYEIY